MLFGAHPVVPVTGGTQLSVYAGGVGASGYVGAGGYNGGANGADYGSFQTPLDATATPLYKGIAIFSWTISFRSLFSGSGGGGQSDVRYLGTYLCVGGGGGTLCIVHRVALILSRQQCVSRCISRSTCLYYCRVTTYSIMFPSNEGGGGHNGNVAGLYGGAGVISTQQWRTQT